MVKNIVAVLIGVLLGFLSIYCLAVILQSFGINHSNSQESEGEIQFGIIGAMIVWYFLSRIIANTVLKIDQNRQFGIGIIAVAITMTAMMVMPKSWWFPW